MEVLLLKTFVSPLMAQQLFQEPSQLEEVHIITNTRLTKHKPNHTTKQHVAQQRIQMSTTQSIWSGDQQHFQHKMEL